jgi:hypothetical protein
MKMNGQPFLVRVGGIFGRGIAFRSKVMRNCALMGLSGTLRKGFDGILNWILLQEPMHTCLSISFRYPGVSNYVVFTIALLVVGEQQIILYMASDDLGHADRSPCTKAKPCSSVFFSCSSRDYHSHLCAGLISKQGDVSDGVQ